MHRYSSNSDSHYPFSPMPERQIFTILHHPRQTDTISTTDAISTKEISSEQPVRTSWFSKLWNVILMISEPRREPTFWQKCDRHGNTWWEGYDPDSDRHLYFSSEDEVRIWLDKSPYFH